jgi:hypothetical protein
VIENKRSQRKVVKREAIRKIRLMEELGGYCIKCALECVLRCKDTEDLEQEIIYLRSVSEGSSFLKGGESILGNKCGQQKGQMDVTMTIYRRDDDDWVQRSGSRIIEKGPNIECVQRISLQFSMFDCVKRVRDRKGQE